MMSRSGHGLGLGGLALVGVMTLGGCAARQEPVRFSVEAGDYDRAFEATRSTLRDANFEIERVDSARGVITTRSRGDAGFFTPWTGYQLDASSALEDSLNQQRRRVRVSFIPVEDESAYTSGGGDQDRIGSRLDEVASRGPWTAYVDVGVTRVQTAGFRPTPRSVLMGTVTIDPVAEAQGVSTIYEVPVSQDPALAAALVKRIMDRMGVEPAANPAPGANQATPTPAAAPAVAPTAPTAPAAPTSDGSPESSDLTPVPEVPTLPQSAPVAPAPEPAREPLIPVPPRRVP